MKRILVICAGFLAALALMAAPAAAATPSEDNCWRQTEVLDYGTHWTYRQEISWCSDGTSVTSFDVSVWIETFDDACVWSGVKESKEDNDSSGTTGFTMGEFVCTIDGGAPHQVNPWVIVTVNPAGAYEVQKGVAG